MVTRRKPSDDARVSGDPGRERVQTPIDKSCDVPCDTRSDRPTSDGGQARQRPVGVGVDDLGRCRAHARREIGDIRPRSETDARSSQQGVQLFADDSEQLAKGPGVAADAYMIVGIRDA